MATAPDLSGRVEGYQRALERTYPDAEVGGLRLLEGHGQNNDVVIVDERIVCRFPRYPAGVARLAREASILRAIRPHVPLPVPDPIRVVDDAPAGQAFMAYPLISGQPLWQESLDAIEDAGTLTRLGKQVGTFLRHLHAVPLSALPHEPTDLLAPWRHLYQRIEARLFPHMRPSAREQVTRHFAAFLDDPRHRAIPPVLTHGDFGTGNILHQPGTDRITGIIDWEEAGVGDAAVDVAALPWTPPAFFAGLIAAYPAVAEADERAAFYRGTFALQEALFGAEHGDEAAFQRGIEPFR